MLCPLINSECVMDTCIWYDEQWNCAVNTIAISIKNIDIPGTYTDDIEHKLDQIKEAINKLSK